jgi:hypothetical protein
MNWIKLNTMKSETEPPANDSSKRFPFGDILTFDGKDYRYLFTSGDNDILFDENTTKIYMIPSKYTEAG